jgi:hypothetical protein
MPLIALFFAWLAPTLTGWAIVFFGRKILVAMTSISTFLLLTAAFIVCIKTLLVTVFGALAMPTWFAMWFGMFVPSNFSVVFSAILASKSCRWAYDLALDKLKLLNSAQ